MGRRDKWDERLEKVDVLRARDLDPTPGPWQRDGAYFRPPKRPPKKR